MKCFKYVLFVNVCPLPTGQQNRVEKNLGIGSSTLEFTHMYIYGLSPVFSNLTYEY